MYTDCPDCNRQFRVTAAHLSAAGGMVRCGFCGAAFNAMERLHDHPHGDLAAKAPESDAVAEPQFDIPEPPPAVPEADRAAPPPAAEEFAPVFEEEEAPPRSSLGWRLLWGTGVMLMLVIGIAQGAWFNRDTLLRYYPQLAPWAQRLCDRFECEVMRFRDPSAITLINRDVRLHPRFEDALLINATIANQWDRAQPFPIVQLVLFDTEERVIAHREFAPREYLAGNVDPEAGMPAGALVHIVLEVSGPTRDAIGFEFSFL